MSHDNLLVNDANSDIQLDSNDDSTSRSLSVNQGEFVGDKQLGSRPRKPFHFQNSVTSYQQSDPLVPTPANETESATYSRYKYYQRLRGPSTTDNTLLIPDHVVPSVFFYPYIPGTDLSTGKQNSIVTVFAVWNTMMGTSLLSMPWAVERAGLAAGLILITLMACICLYTAYRNLQVYSLYGEQEHLDDFPDLCQFLLGRWGHVAAILFSALSLLGAAIVYWVLMSNFLFHTVQYIYDQITGTPSSFMDETNTTYNLICQNSNQSNFTAIENYSDTDTSVFSKYWDLNVTVPIYLALILAPLLCIKSATFFTKFNAFGTLSVFYIVAFVITKAANWGLHIDFNNYQSPFYIPLVQPNFPALSGMLALALFLHNCVITIMKNNKHQENNARDLSVAYVLVALTYLAIGATFYLTFPLQKDCIEDNFLNNFLRTDTLTVAARVFLLFQMTTVFPLLVYILRAQLLHAIYNSVYPSFCHVTVLNAVLVIICILFAIFLPQVGTITRFSGALCGLVYIFTLPCILHIVSLRKQNDGKWPIGSMIVHGIIVVCGILNLIAQFAVSD